MISESAKDQKSDLIEVKDVDFFFAAPHNYRIDLDQNPHSIYWVQVRFVSHFATPNSFERIRIILNKCISRIA